ncbi:MAG TPA: GIY-YIG nuclease family protein [Candidatus Portnoybacteria bacterium]|nr:GIY-YIG nuclease family protein [Candidatus Portnoybacteria bacterium]
MYYVYLLRLEGIKNKDFYIGCTSDLKERMKQHLAGETKTTKDKNPTLIYYEAYNNKYLALKREKGIKGSGSVYMALMKRLGLK